MTALVNVPIRPGKKTASCGTVVGSSVFVAITVITTNTVDPTTVPQEAVFLPGLIGTFTSAVMSFVRTAYPNCRFEVLYPTDVNNFALTQVINYPTATWTPANLTCLKTESFTYTCERNLDMSLATIDFGTSL